MVGPVRGQVNGVYAADFARHQGGQVKVHVVVDRSGRDGQHIIASAAVDAAKVRARDFAVAAEVFQGKGIHARAAFEVIRDPLVGQGATVGGLHAHHIILHMQGLAAVGVHRVARNTGPGVYDPARAGQLISIARIAPDNQGGAALTAGVGRERAGVQADAVAAVAADVDNFQAGQFIAHQAGEVEDVVAAAQLQSVLPCAAGDFGKAVLGKGLAACAVAQDEEIVAGIAVERVRG